MQRNFALAGPEGKTGPADDPFARTVRWTGDGSVERAVAALAGADLRCAHFADPAFFADEARGLNLCRLLRERVNLLWSARLADVPGRELLRAMRLAGCQRVVVSRDGEPAAEEIPRLRGFGFDYAFVPSDGEKEAGHAAYTVAEREAVAGELPGLHAVQFDLAVAYFNARRYGDVMRPLGKAMTLRFPANELCLNLLACLSAARHYPDVAAGLLIQADYGWPHPVVMRNRRLLRSWLESGGDVRGVRLVLEAEGRAVPAR
ncbi:hypothetical protein [Pseudodesulfovibrio sp.]|uniref:hypothetical protein n=1 Tax=Pseudodesulfovibrio sp. TaxID=2035812 RepID=UPI002638DDD7|nr:hypothetical protein [Pseudodesulfovibrio sp.]MDD3311263.1 hypothetical protein [Pseudodesulfovibrio sp.]